MPAKRNSIMLCLVQCGETSWDLDGRVQGATDLPLCESGRSAVNGQLHLLDAVKAGVVYHPADEAAEATAALCAGRIGAKTKAVEELADPNLGLLEGLTEQDFAERYPSRCKQWLEDPLSLSPPEGEEIADAADRVFKAVARILKRSKHDEVVVVLHPLALGMMRCWMADRPMSDSWPLLVSRPRVERYAVPTEMIGRLEAAVERVHARN